MPDDDRMARLEDKLDRILAIIDRYERLLAAQGGAMAWGMARKARRVPGSSGPTD